MLFITGIARLNLKIPVILCDNLKRQLHKTYCPASVTLLHLLRKHWHFHRSECRTPLTYTHCHCFSLGPLTLPASEAADFIELILLFTWSDLVNALVNFGAHNC